MIDFAPTVRPGFFLCACDGVMADGSRGVTGGRSVIASEIGKVHEVPDKSIIVARTSGIGLSGLTLQITPEGGGPATLSASQVQALRLLLDAETNTERDRLGSWIPTLAMIGSVSPLLGLLGTVLGIIEAFLGVARGGSGNLAAIAPGVAEALIATATALAVAIPAYFGYNIFADAGYMAVWGDGSAGSVTQGYSSILALGSAQFTGFGRLPQGQYVAAGSYGDHITVTVTF